MIERAKVVLAELEAEDRDRPMRGFEDLPLFQAARPLSAAASAPADALIAALEALHPDEMSPRESMEALYALKAKLAQIGG